MTPKNNERADRATAALLHYKREYLHETNNLGQDTVTDLLTDILHHLEQCGEAHAASRLDQMLVSATQHYIAERTESQVACEV